MRSLKRFLALLYFLSIFVGVAHELSHSHHIGEHCSVCVLSHTPAVPAQAQAITLVDVPHDTFEKIYTTHAKPLCVLSKSRSPPLS